MSEIGASGAERKVRIAGPVRRNLGKILMGVSLFFLLYYPIGMIWIHTINDDVAFEPTGSNRVNGGSYTVSVAAGLIDREINQYRWTANDPFFVPSAALDNMPNYQQGIISALARFSFELTDQIGRTRGSSQTDPDLQEAAGLLQYSGTKWLWDPTISLLPTAASERQYEKARLSLINYNKRLTNKQAVFEKRADNLLATIDRIALDLGSSTAVLDKHIIENSGNYLDFLADDQFYNIKGQVYTYYLILSALGDDYANLIGEKELTHAWQLMTGSLKSVVDLDPWIIINAAPDAQLLPNHLAAQGFFVLRARTQLREISNILLK